MKKFNFIINGSDYSVEVKNIDENNIAEVVVNGIPYSVEIKKDIEEENTPINIRKDVIKKIPTPIVPVKKSAGGEAIKSPLPGTIIKILVEIGTTVKIGDVLLTMEAMKMENNILAEKAGVVKNIAVSLGQAVLQGDTLIELE